MTTRFAFILTATVLLAGACAQRRPFFEDESVFAVDLDQNLAEMPRVSADVHSPTQLSYDVAILEFADDGTFAAPQQLGAAIQAIDRARDEFQAGAIVLLFIHGWRHNAAWDSQTEGDSHFQAFRKVLAGLAGREAERGDQRKPVGIYVGWNGDSPFEVASFWQKYRVAERIGSGEDMREALRAITSHAKEQNPDGTTSQLILAGHSMGALMLESALLALVRDGGTLLQPQRENQAVAVQTWIDGEPVLFPDAVVSLNSAADAAICKALKSELSRRRVTKTADVGDIRYSAPLLVSITSTADEATGKWWPRAKGGRRTIGHETSLITHMCSVEGGVASCEPRGPIDFGQSFHCLREPEPLICSTPRIAVDLPVRERTGRDDPGEHARYLLIPLGTTDRAELVWNFQVPPGLIEDHNDIFNSRSSSLVLAMMQVSGAVASLAQEWRDSFE